MRERYTQIGFDRKICLEWLEDTTDLLCADKQPSEIFEKLEELLLDQVSKGNHAPRNSREKTITILMRSWVSVPNELTTLRDEGLKMLQTLSGRQRQSVHMGMIMAVYPFVRIVAENTGRLLRIQGVVTTSQVQRRVQEKYGERSTVVYAVGRVISSFVDWGLLSRKGRAGKYCLSGEVEPVGEELTLWLMEALLHSIPQGQAPLETLLDFPALFPFKLTWLPPQTVNRSQRISVFSHGLDQQLLILDTPATKF
ncbi:MAG: hypothetical protein PHH90_03785 [Limnochordia bacterium]|nr:hypothetical protein [Limnochordia bacterium]